MAITNRQRIDNGLTELSAGLAPFVERELKSHLGDKWIDQLQQSFRVTIKDDGSVHWDAYAVLKAMSEHWNTTFRKTLGRTERSWVIEITDIRNAHAHEEKISYDDTERALDTIRRLLASAGAAPHAEKVAEIRKECIRVQQAEEARGETRKVVAVSGNPSAGLKPWREVITPHEDVAKGRYMEAEFAADLNLVHRGGPDVPAEYGDPKEFFARTFLTDGLKDLLSIGARRLNGESADPVVELQTNFGGGKTHSMLALYHLVSGVKPADLAGVAEYFAEEKIPALPKANRAVLVGNNFSAAEVDKKDDGTEVRTLWGEMAWQLGGAKAYALVEESDKAGTSPGKELLGKVMEQTSPCLVLIDEWVALLRQLPREGDLPAGTYESNISFAQSLTEAAKGVKGALVVASLPVSSIEVGGTRGEQALAELQNVVKRVAKPWTPANSNEGFEIVRRRLFKDSLDAPGRDAVVNAFSKMYKESSGEFPSDCKEAEYKRKLESCYPIHPELFHQFEGWATLDKFQRTRGILRLMASVIYELWNRDDRSLLIMPSSITLDTRRVVSLIKECLADGPQWESVISRDIDGPDSLTLKTDNQHMGTLGRYSASRRVARTIFMGSAPTIGGNNPGLTDERMRLGCTQPGEAVATFGDALKRLTDNAVHLYVGQNRYWYSLEPTVTRLAKDRSEQFDQLDVETEIVRRLRKERESGDFDGLHIAPETSADVPDEMGGRLIILGPDAIQTGTDLKSPAIKNAAEILEKRGNSPRTLRNTLLFLAPDGKRLKDLEQSIRGYLAWKGILDDVEADGMDLTNHSKMQVRNKVDETDKAAGLRIHETWSKALVPSQPDPTKPDITWELVTVGGDEALAKKVSKKVVSQEALFTNLGAPRLQMELDRYLWASDDHITLKALLEHFASYLYLPRLVNQRVLQSGIENQISGTIPEYFGYASSYDEEKKRYKGLCTSGFRGNVMFDGAGMLVKLTTAGKQLAAEAAASVEGGATTTEGTPTNQGGATPAPGGTTEPTPEGVTQPKHFYGTLTLDPTKAGLRFSEVMNEVVQHFSRSPQNKVAIQVEIRAESPEGFEENTVRTTKENANTLGFDSHEFSD